MPYEGPLPADAIEVTGARNDDGVLKLTVRTDGVSPAEVFGAVLRHSNDEIQRLVEAMDRELPPAAPPPSPAAGPAWPPCGAPGPRSSATAASARDQETAYGAARVAARLLTTSSRLTEPDHPSTEDWNRTMNPLTTLERRGMAAISTPAGRMLIVAADQRNGMKAVMTDAPGGPGSITVAELAAAKADLVRLPGQQRPRDPARPEVALPAVVDDGVLARGTALVVGMDASGYETIDGLRYTRFVAGVTARRVRELGGDVAKMLLYVRPDRQDAGLARRRRDPRAGRSLRGRGRAADRRAAHLPARGRDRGGVRGGVPGPGRRRRPAGRRVRREGAEAAVPRLRRGCAAVTAAADGVPWAVLSAGVDHETFIEQVAIAMANGASGAMAGRSLWKDSLSVSSALRQDYLTKRALPRLHELAEVVDGTGLTFGMNRTDYAWLKR